MANGFGTLYIGQSGLTSAQNALNTTANNLSNVDTTGYVRQQVRFADKTYSTIQDAQATTNIMQAGLGVTIGDVVHARDVFMDKAFRQESGREAFYSTCYETTSGVEDLLQELDGEEFADSITDLYTAIEEMAKDPSDSTNQNLLLQKCELFLSRSSSLYSDLKSYQSNLNDQISDAIDSINEKGNKIYELNLQIQKVEAGGVETAMTLRDERDTLIDELSAIVKIEATEDNTGFTHIEIEGQEFVYDGGCNNLACEEDEETGFYRPYWPNLSNKTTGDTFYLYDVNPTAKTDDNTDIGELKALIIQRGDHYGTMYDMADETSYAAIESSTLMETEAEIDNLFNHVAEVLNNLFCPNESVSDAASAGDTNLSGLTTVSVSDTDIDAEISTYHLIGGKASDGKYLELGTSATGQTIIVAEESAQILDVDNCYYGTDYELPPREIFTRNTEDRYEAVTIGDSTYYVYNSPDTENRNTWYHLGTTSVNAELQKQITLMPAYTKNGTVAYDLGTKLSAAWTDASMNLNPTDATPVDFEGYYNKMIGKLGTDGSVYSAAEDTLTSTTAALDNQRTQVTGVSSDEELTNMVKFQQAYNASSRFMTVISEMTEVIVNLLS